MFNLFNKSSKKSSRRFDRPKRRPTRKQREQSEARKRAVKIAAFLVVPVLAVSLAYPYINAMMNIVEPDPVTNCYEGMPGQQFTSVMVDHSTTNLFADEAQMQALKIALRDTYTLMPANGRLDVFTTAKDMSSGMASPVYSVCKPASTTADYAVLKQHEPLIEDMSQAELTYQANKAQENFSQEMDELIAKSQATKKTEDWDAPLFVTFKGISRYYHARGHAVDRLLIYSAGIVASQNTFWCKYRNNLRSWKEFKKLPLYRKVKPFQSFEGMAVTFLMPDILVRYRQGKWCNVQQIQKFWTGYFDDAEARELDLQTLQYRPTARKKQKQPHRQERRAS